MRLPLIGHVIWDRAYEAGQRDALAFDKDHDHDCSYEQGQRDERERIRIGVTGLPDWKFCDAVCGTERSVLAVIDGEASA